MTDAPVFSELTTSTLDANTLTALFADLATHTEIIEIIAKAGAEAYAGDKRLTLADAHQLITSGAVRGIQIRYRYQNDEWWDTLMKTPDGIRIVRVKQNFDGVMGT